MGQVLAPIRQDWDWADLRRRSRAEALRVLGDPYTADEAAQEAMTRAWRQRHRCRTPGRPTAWVAQIARNEALRVRAGERRHWSTGLARRWIWTWPRSPPNTISALARPLKTGSSAM